ncbi:DIP1984 family protein [Paracoccus sp. MKU1]|uniref:DIP1984 family protein n=1 Tax=Paracoccus sp. MKU1 TaxID=1745182 RepID=UPI00193DFD19|nr:DIP1984 family protein [Paracoccus sp. MKU1]
MTMKLAEALVQRSDMTKRLEQLKARLLRNAKVQEGDEPAEDPASLLAEHDRLAADLQRMIARINRTNSRTAFDGGVLTDALAARDVLRLRQGAYRDLAEEATLTWMVGTRSEVRWRPMISVAQVQKTADALAKELRDLDSRVQEANWHTELMD